MKKIIIIGCPGSGKSTFARNLAAKINLPLYYLDMLYWNADKTTVSKEVFRERLNNVISEDKWIIDGNYSRTIESRIIACDTVILFDLPVEVCLDGAISRLGKERYDMPWIDKELDPRLKKEIEEFPNKNLPDIYTLLEKYRDKNIVVFKSREDADKFLSEEI